MASFPPGRFAARIIIVITTEICYRQAEAAISRRCSAKGEGSMSKEVFERGLAIRKEVLGAEFVENSFRTADDFNRPMQELVTEYCWGAVWGRETLPRKVRSMLNLAMLSALNRPHELEAHIKGALKNGVSRDEIREVLLQVAIYCGVPAGVDSFRTARKVFADLDGAKTA
jgi:4-carboxymuconolactone decarboxylase